MKITHIEYSIFNDNQINMHFEDHNLWYGYYNDGEVTIDHNVMVDEELKNIIIDEIGEILSNMNIMPWKIFELVEYGDQS